MVGMPILINWATATAWGILGALKAYPHADQSSQMKWVGIAEMAMAIAIVTRIRPALVHATALCALAIFGSYHLWASLAMPRFTACSCAGKIEVSHGTMATIIAVLAVAHYSRTVSACKEKIVAH